MSVDLKKALAKKLPPKEGGEVFKFETVGDQLVFKYLARRTVKTQRGDDSDLIDADVLGGERVDPKTKKVLPIKPGPMVFFLGTHLKRIFDEESSTTGNTYHVQLSEIRKDKNNMKLFGVECLERALRDDDIPDFKAP